MEIYSVFNTKDELVELPPGFRFHPTDEELITHYLSPKVHNRSFSTKSIGEVDLNKVEPWDLPWMAKMGEKEWYFFCIRDRKYPTGLRTNRATDAGYWKATGKDKEIYGSKILVGMKKTLVFYTGRAPKGEKTNWVMHEYRLEDKNSIHKLPKTAKNEWVISRIFKKSSGGKKVHISRLLRSTDSDLDSGTCDLPQLIDISSSNENPINNSTSAAIDRSHVSCLSNPTANFHYKMVDDFSFIPGKENLQHVDSVYIQDQSILRVLLENNGRKTKRNHEGEEDDVMNANMSSTILGHEVVGFKPYEDQEFSMIMSNSPVDLDCLWNYY